MSLLQNFKMLGKVEGISKSLARRAPMALRERKNAQARRTSVGAKTKTPTTWSERQDCEARTSQPLQGLF